MTVKTVCAIAALLLAASSHADKQLDYYEKDPQSSGETRVLHAKLDIPLLLTGCDGLSHLWTSPACSVHVDKHTSTISIPQAYEFTAALAQPTVEGSDRFKLPVRLQVSFKDGTGKIVVEDMDGNMQPTSLNADRNSYSAHWVATSESKPLRLRIFSNEAATVDISYANEEQNNAVARSLQAVTPLPLPNGVPATGFVPQNGWLIYTFPVQTNTFTRLDVIVTPVVGDPDLYISLNGAQPSLSNYQYRSTSLFGTDSAIIRANDTQFTSNCGSLGTCPILIGVYGWRRANFTLTATLAGGITTLSNGWPFLDSVAASDYQYYSFGATIAAGTASVSIQLTPFSGDPDVYVGNTALNMTRPNRNQPNSFCTYSTTGQRDVVDLHPGMPCWCKPPCTYYISVYGFGNPASYSILAIEEDNVTVTLINGIPQAGYVAQAESNQYLFYATPDPTIPGRQVIELSITPYFGDPDLFVTLDGSFPTPTHFDYRSINANGQDYVAIRTTDPKYVNSVCGRNPGSACAVRAAVFGFDGSIYTILANSGRYVQLQDGRQIVDNVDSGTYVYYRFTSAISNQVIYITVQPLSGDPDVYVGSDKNATRTSQPTSAAGSYYWRSSGFGTEVIAIQPTDAGACTPPCNYYIGVYGYRSNSSFSIMAKTVSVDPTPLVIGQPQNDEAVTGQWNFYTASFFSTEMQITVSPLYGDPDLYVRLGNNSFNPRTMGPPVTPTTAQYVSNHFSGVESISISPNDQAYKTSCGSVSVCVAYIGVLGYDATAYSVVASTGATALPDGVPISGSVNANSYVYYRYTLTNYLPVSIAVTPLTGDPDLFVSTIVTKPNMTNFQWRSNGFGNEVVSISPAQLASCALPCNIYISVLGWGAGATFTISATSSTFTTLVSGNPVVATASAWSFAYFIYNNNNNPEGIEFTVTPFSGGDVSVYVNNQLDATGSVGLPSLTCNPATCPTWSVANSQWSSVGSVSRERVVIPPVPPMYKATGQYIVGVLAIGQAAQFAITGSVIGSITRLQPSVPFTDVVAQGVYNYYKLVMNTPNTDVLVTVTPFFGDPDLFISYHSTVMFPNASTADRRSQAGTGNDAIYIQYADMPECAANANGLVDCDIWISVYGFTNASYSITPVLVGANNVTSQLLDGVPADGQVAASQYTYYYANVNVQPGTAFSIYLRPVTGDPDLYIRTDGQLPSRTFYQASSTRFSGDEVINISPDKSYYNNSCILRIAVYGFSAATYQITYSSSSAVTQLADGVSQFGTVSGSQVYNYFSFAVGPVPYDVTFSLTALSGDPDIYIGVWTTPQFRPTSSPSQHTWAGTFFGDDSVTIPATSGCMNCQYIAGVMCAIGVSCRYSLTASASTSSLIQLTDGQPLSNTVANHGWKYFLYNTGGDAKLVNVTFQVVSSTGNAQLYITNLYTPGSSPASALPTNVNGNYVWSSAFGGSTTGSGIVNIVGSTDSHVQSNQQLYTIGVYGVFGPASFTISASTAAAVQTLVPGQPSPQHSLTPGAPAQLYNAPVTDPTKDFTVSVTLMSGTDSNVLIAVSNSSLPTCSFNAQGQVTTCNAIWTTIATQTSQLRIVAATPCSGGAVTGPCDGYSWHAGPYYIAVYALGAPINYAITASASASFQRLFDGQPVQSSTTSNVAPVFNFQTSYDPSLPDVRISIAASSTPLVFYMTSCYETGCSVADTQPSPNNFEYLNSVNAQASQDFFITRLSPVYCANVSCNYFISVYPLTQCQPPQCTAAFSILAAEQDGQLTRVTFASIDNKVALMPGNIAPGGDAVYELYLTPTRPVNVNVRLESCGPGSPTLFVCNPGQTGGSTCTDPFSPGPAVWALPHSQGREASRQLQNTNWGYSLAVSAGQARVLWPGVNSTLTIAPSGVSVNVSWSPATIGTYAARGTTIAQGVKYTVFTASKGFQGNGVVPTTPCGLSTWASNNPQIEPVTVSGVSYAVINNLNPNQYYEFNVMAVCDGACWAINAAEGDEDVGVGAPGYNIQRVAYSVAGADTGDTPTPTTEEGGFPAAGVAAIVLSLFAVGGGGFLYMRYRKQKATDHTEQYNNLDVLEAMDTISVPTQRGGILSSVKGMLSINRSSSGGATGAPSRAALSDSHYSQLEDKADAFL